MVFYIFAYVGIFLTYSRILSKKPPKDDTTMG